MSPCSPLRLVYLFLLAASVELGFPAGQLLAADAPAAEARKIAERLGSGPGICVLLGSDDDVLPLNLAARSGWLVYVQADDANSAQRVARAAEAAGMLGTRVCVEQGAPTRVPLASNLADAALLGPTADSKAARDELLRVLHPGGRLVVGDETIVKPRPAGADDWSHPYHTPDNNPQSRDAAARGALLTQFLAEPWYVPMPQVTVASGGRVFKAFGHIALKEREWPWLNSLVAINGFNGTQLWKRPLKAGFMIHRNTLIATPELVYLGDDESCKLLDAATGELKDEIVVPRKVDAGGVWKWMALDGDVLFALVGEKEPLDKTIRGTRQPAGWPWKELGDGYAGAYEWGFGRTLLAIDPASKRVLWTYKSDEPLDGRAMCMADGRIFIYSRGKFLAAVSANDGKELWNTKDPKLLEAIGSDDHAQNPIQGFASSSYVKANARGLYFAGPQRARLVGVSAENGKLLWQYPHGNFQLVLRGDGLYAMGRTETSKVFDYLTGRVLADLECYRGNCTRATATLDSIFTRGYRHTGTMQLDLSGNRPRRIPLMRPACQDGVIVADGNFYWGPWMCDCNHSLVGMICLSPAGDFQFDREATDAERLETSPGAKSFRPRMTSDASDWPAYRSGPTRQSTSSIAVEDSAHELWRHEAKSAAEPTGPIAVGDRVFWSGLDGIVRCADAATGRIEWTAYVGGAVRFPPEFRAGRLYVGSGDGRMYCFDAATGKRLWRFRAAPEDRRIAVHGELLSNWPVGSGVLVADDDRSADNSGSGGKSGVVYAAAGITSYDGTHVYALDAETGRIRWQNNTSGRLAGDDRMTGVSVQGHLLLSDGKLYLAGGNIVSPVEYDARDGKCLSKISNEWMTAAGADAAFPTPDNYKGTEFLRSPRGRELFLVDGQVRVFDELLYSPPQYGPSRYFGGHYLEAGSGDTVVRATFDRVVRLAGKTTGDGQPVGLWQSAAFADPQALAVTKNAVLVAGKKSQAREGQSAYMLSALRLADGKLLWSVPLPVAPVPWGLAVDRRGRAIVTLTNGQVIAAGG